ncbi:MAG: protein kinase, partial [Candidatus Aureabacteria bacterium]|nr:protein kinase [Candidatus Auribacterota bacterium]
MEKSCTCRNCGASFLPDKTQQEYVLCPRCGHPFLSEQSLSIGNKLQSLILPFDREELKDAVHGITEKFGADIFCAFHANETLRRPARGVSDLLDRIKKVDFIILPDSEGGSDYQFIRRLGKGNFGEVYLAEQVSLKRKVELEVSGEVSDIDEASKAAFLSEAVLGGIFDHPNILPVIDAASDAGGRLFHARKMIRGVSWEKLLHPETKEEKEKAEKYGLEDHLDILQSVCNAVSFAHSKNIIHRDIKPSHVMIGNFDEVILQGWGLCFSLNGFENVLSLKNSDFGGTLGYMPPELAVFDSSKIGRTSDVFLLGATLYEILAGHPPHHGDSGQDVLASAITNSIRPPQDEKTSHLELYQIALKAMAPDPSDRYQTASELNDVVSMCREHAEKIRESIRLEKHADFYFCLGQARGENYSMRFLDSILLFKESLNLWPENREAEEKLLRSNKVYAESALEKENYDLALSVIDEEGDKNTDLVRNILREKKKSERTKRWFNALRYAAFFLSLVMSVLLGAGYQGIAKRYRYVIKGNEYFQKGEIDKAIAEYDRAISMKGDFSEAYHRKKFASIQKGEMEGTSFLFGEKMEILPELPLVSYSEGLLTFTMGEFGRFEPKSKRFTGAGLLSSEDLSDLKDEMTRSFQEAGLKDKKKKDFFSGAEALSMEVVILLVTAAVIIGVIASFKIYEVFSGYKKKAASRGQKGTVFLSVDELIRDLKSENVGLRRDAVVKMASVDSSRIMVPLINALRDDDAVVRKAAASILGEKRKKRAVVPLIGLLKDPDESVRIISVIGLGRIGDERAAEPLMGALKDPELMVRVYAAVALGRMKSSK